MGDAPGPARRDRALDQVLRIIEGVGVVDTAETGAGTGLVAALDAVLGHELAATDVLVLLVTDQIGGGLLVNGNVLEDVGGKRLGLDVDVPAGQARGEAGVLALLADGEGQLVVGHDDAGVGLLLVDKDAGDLGGRQGVGDVDGRIGIPQDDVDALATELAHDGANTAALGADAGANGIQTIVERVDGDLGALAGLAGDRLDLDGAS